MKDELKPNEAHMWCIFCKHKWIIRSNKPLIQRQFDMWFKYVLKEHKKLHGK